MAPPAGDCVAFGSQVAVTAGGESGAVHAPVPPLLLAPPLLLPPPSVCAPESAPPPEPLLELHACDARHARHAAASKARRLTAASLPLVERPGMLPRRRRASVRP